MDKSPENSKVIIGVVGPCAAGKTTLVRRLCELGYQAHVIAQEHSYVPDMWQRMTHPDILIFLSASHQNTLTRRNMAWTEAEYQEQLFRLRHAFANADLLIDTDQLTPEEVLEEVLLFLNPLQT